MNREDQLCMEWKTISFSIQRELNKRFANPSKLHELRLKRKAVALLHQAETKKRLAA